MTRVLYIWCILLVLASCDGRDEYSDGIYNSNQYLPVLMTREQLNKSIKYLSPRDLVNPGKIYFKDNFIFVVELYKGVHVIKNENPKSPQVIGFITVPGCVDIAMKQNIMYADNAIDLVSISLNNDYAGFSGIERITNVFPALVPPDGNRYYNSSSFPPNTVVVEWKKQE